MLDLFPSWAEIKDFLAEFGLQNGISIIFFFGMHAWLYRQYEGRLKDRQGEIDRLAADVHDLRDRLLALLDKHFGYTPPKGSKQKTGPPGEKS